MNSTLFRFLHSRRELFVIGLTGSTLAADYISRIADSSDTLRSNSHLAVFNASHCACESVKDKQKLQAQIPSPSLWRRLLVPIGILPLPRLLTPKDPAFKLSKRFLRKRQNDDERMRKLVTEQGPKFANKASSEEQLASLQREIFEIAYGKGVTAQMREDFLIRYGCTGFNDSILKRVLDLCATRGLVEVGAGHGQWQRALNDAYNEAQDDTSNNQKRKFDFVLAYDDNSELPLNTHIYNQYTQPHHDHFGSVQKLESPGDLARVLRSWACRGRALLMVYPPPGPMAIDTLKLYAEASPENDTLIYVGEGRGGANGDETFFDFLESGEWILIDILDVTRPPGDKDKGCERLYILQKVRKDV